MSLNVNIFSHSPTLAKKRVKREICWIFAKILSLFWFGVCYQTTGEREEDEHWIDREKGVLSGIRCLLIVKSWIIGLKMLENHLLQINNNHDSNLSIFAVIYGFCPLVVVVVLTSFAKSLTDDGVEVCKHKRFQHQVPRNTVQGWYCIWHQILPFAFT